MFYKSDRTVEGKRGLGLGFGQGNAFNLFKHEPNRGLVNPLPLSSELITKIRVLLLKLINLAKNDKNLLQLSNVIKEHFVNPTEGEVDELLKHILALIIPDVLVDINVTKLQKILPVLLTKISKDVITLFTKNGLDQFCDPAGTRFLRSIIISKYKLFTSSNLEELVIVKVNELKNSLTVEKIHTIEPEILAYLIPALLDRMNDNDLKNASFAIALELSNKYFRVIADNSYFIPQMNLVDNDKLILNNSNKRSLQFFTGSSSSVVNIRGETYRLQHTHIHFEKEGEENEYELDGVKFDGEVHSVFEYDHKGNSNKKRLLAIGFPLKIAIQDNPQIADLLNFINQLEEVVLWKKSLKAWEENPEGKKPVLVLDKKKLAMNANYKNLFMDHFDRATEEGAFLYHSWASLRSNTYGFRAGLKFLIVPFAIKISANQYAELKEIFGEMNKELSEEDKLDPIDRKAGHRITRNTLSKFLEEKIETLSMSIQQQVGRAPGPTLP